MSGHPNQLLYCMTCTDFIAPASQARKLTQASPNLNPLTAIGRFDWEPYSERKDWAERTTDVICLSTSIVNTSARKCEKWHYFVGRRGRSGKEKAQSRWKEDAYCGSGPCFLTLIDYMVLVKQFRSTFLMQLNAPSDQSITSFVLLDGDRLNGAWALAFRNQVREFISSLFCLESIQKGSYEKHGIGLAHAGMEPTNKVI